MTLSYQLTYHLSDTSAIKQHLITMTPKNSYPPIYKRFSMTIQEPSVKITILQPLRQYALKIKKKKLTNKITFNTGINILNIFNN